MLKLCVKGKRERTWCVAHAKLHEGKRCPKCVADKRWQNRRLAEMMTVVRRLEELYGRAN